MPLWPQQTTNYTMKMKMIQCRQQIPWISETKTHGKADTLQGESWLHYLMDKKRRKRGQGRLVCPTVAYCFGCVRYDL